MKGFVKFVSIMAFGIFCFIGGVAKGRGKNSVALYCILGGTMMLLNGFATITEIETNEIMEKNPKKTDGLFKKTENLTRKIEA